MDKKQWWVMAALVIVLAAPVGLAAACPGGQARAAPAGWKGWPTATIF